jgi:PAS domain S-box-containing protein
MPPAEWRNVEPVLRAIARDLPNAAIFVVDHSMRYLLVEGEALGSAGLDAESLEGRSLQDALTPEQLEKYRPDYERILAGHTFECERESHGRFYSSRGVPLRDASGRVYAAMVCAYDITSRRQSELLHEAKERALAEADRYKDEFLTALAHELRSPISAVHAGLQVATRTEGMPAQLQAVVAMMQRQLNQLARLVGELTDLECIRRGSFRLQLSVQSLTDVLNQSVEATRSTIERHGHKLIVEYSPQELKVNADQARLVQVFTNLLVNGAKYSTPGGRICLSVAREGTDAIVHVSDQGLGISEHDLPRIFEAGVQVHRNVSGIEGGFGLGLSLVRAIVRLHSGEVTARSGGPGKGSTFTVRLPLAQG